MLKALRISFLLLVLGVVAIDYWLTSARNTDWDRELWVKIYPINADGSESAARYIGRLTREDFAAIEQFFASEAGRWGSANRRPVRLQLGSEIREQPPSVGDEPGILDVMLWSLKLRWWASSATDDQDRPPPDVRIFLRYHEDTGDFLLDNSVGLEKGSVGIVNGFAGPAHAGLNNFIIAHELLHTLGATDKYERASGQPAFPDGYAEPERQPLHPQRFAEIMGGRIALTVNEAVEPDSLRDARIGERTAREIRLTGS